jgi:hypothetical protein
LATWKGCWRRSGGPCRIERPTDPPPRPSPARGEGAYSEARSSTCGACLASAPSRDKVDRLEVPRRHWLVAETWWASRDAICSPLEEQGGRCPASAGASAGA